MYIFRQPSLIYNVCSVKLPVLLLGIKQKTTINSIPFPLYPIRRENSTRRHSELCKLTRRQQDFSVHDNSGTGQAPDSSSPRNSFHKQRCQAKKTTAEEKKEEEKGRRERSHARAASILWLERRPGRANWKVDRQLAKAFNNNLINHERYKHLLCINYQILILHRPYLWKWGTDCNSTIWTQCHNNESPAGIHIT